MTDGLVDLDFVSSAFFVGEAPGFSHSLMTMIRLEGPADVEALVASVGDAYDTTPRFRSRVVERGGPLLHRWAWRPEPDPEPTRVLRVSDEGHDDGLAAIVDTLYDRGRRARDLRHEQASRCTIGVVSPEVTVVAFERHHAVGDAAAGLAFLRDLFAAHHRRVTGQSPAWSDVAPMHASPGAARRDGAGVRGLIRLARTRRGPHGEYVGTPLVVTGTEGDEPRQLIARATIADTGTITALRRRARSLDATLTDLAIAASMRAVADLRERFGDEPGVQRFSIPVTQPLRGDDRNANELSQIVVGSRPGDLDDAEGLIRSLARQRKAAFEAGIDITVSRTVAALSPTRFVDPGGPFSQRLRSRAMSAPPTVTAMLSNPGVFWPEIRDGRPTGAMALSQTGGLRVADHLTVMNGGPGSVLLSTFDGRLRLDLAQNAAYMTQSEMDAFIASVKRELLALL